VNEERGAGAASACHPNRSASSAEFAFVCCPHSNNAGWISGLVLFSILSEDGALKKGRGQREVLSRRCHYI
jgi:hypothetical protein